MLNLFYFFFFCALKFQTLSFISPLPTSIIHHWLFFLVVLLSLFLCIMTTSISKHSKSVNEKPDSDSNQASRKNMGLNIEGYPVEGISIGGHETCIIFPTLKLAFDIGRCPQRAISQDFLFISHGHMDHIVSSFVIS